MLREEMILCAHCYFDTAWHTFGQLIVFTRHYYERLQYPGTTQGVDYLSQFQFVYQSIHIEFVLSPNDSNDTFTRRKLFVFQVSICFNAYALKRLSILPLLYHPSTHIAAHPIVFHKTLCIIIITCREYSISKCNSSNNSLLANVSTLLSTLLLSTTRWENSLRRCCAQQVLGNKKKKTPKLVGSSN